MLRILAFSFLFHLITGDSYQDIDHFSYFVSIRNSSDDIILCGGAVIHSQWILSTASCLEDTTDVFVYNENFNLHYDDKYSIKNIIIHPEFSYEVNYKSMEVLYYRNDIALIKVNEAIYVEPIALGKTQVGAKVFSIAYSHYVPFPKEQQFYNLTTIRSAPGLCTDSDEYICTRIRSRKMYCFWHKGSLLIDRSRNGDKLIGIGSHFEDFCEVRYSGIFARVATYVFWIKNVTGVDFTI